jgi:hypothetical protein
MKTSEVFKHARYLIRDSGEYPYICRAICRLQFFPIHNRARAIDIIESRIFPARTIEGWISRVRPNDAKIATDKDFHEFRIRWLKALEEEFKQKGD